MSKILNNTIPTKNEVLEKKAYRLEMVGTWVFGISIIAAAFMVFIAFMDSTPIFVLWAVVSLAIGYLPYFLASVSASYYRVIIDISTDIKNIKRSKENDNN